MLLGLLGQLVGFDRGLLLYAGYLLFLIALIALAVSMWRRANRVGNVAAMMAPSGLDPATATR